MDEDQSVLSHMKNCPYCGSEIAVETIFCWYCKRELEAPPEQASPAETSGSLGRWLLVTIAAIAAFIVILVLVLPLF